jgi:hypothetical protein
MTGGLRRRRWRVQLVPRKHIKYEGIKEATIKRYRRQITSYFTFLEDNGLPTPSSLDDLDESVGEYINHLYQDDYLVNYGNDLVSGLKRFYPKCRRQLETSSGYMRSWSKSLHRRRALPLPSDLVIAMAAIAIMRDWQSMAVALLLGFAGLLRTGEILALTTNHMSVHGSGSLLVLTLPNTKSGFRKGETEHVLIYDQAIIELTKKVISYKAPGASLLDMTFREFSGKICDLAACFGCRDPTLTPYCLSRGGATWHFTTYKSYDSTQALGRWGSAKTARQYINQAISEIAYMKIPHWGRDRIQKGGRVLEALIKTLPH